MLLFLWLRHRDWFKKGDFLLMYIMSYGTARFLLEYLRIEVAMSGGVNVSQVFSLAAALIAAALFVYRHRDSLRRRSVDRRAGKRPRKA